MSVTQFENSFGMNINRIGFGGIPIQRLTEFDAISLIQYACSKGINFIDTARGYTDSEEKIGKALKGTDFKIFIATKSMSREYESIKNDIFTSLEKLRRNHIDLYQCHFVNKETDLEAILNLDNGAYKALEEAKKHGLVHHIGITGHIPKVLVKAVKSGKFESVQVPHNIIETICEEELLPLCKKQNISVIAMKPAAGGALSNVKLNLRYILNAGSVIAIPGMDKHNQVDDNLSILPDIKPLNREEKELLLADKTKWNGQFCRRCEYCMPCPQGLNIPFLLLLEVYWERYLLQDWVFQRLDALKKMYSDCIECKICESKCAYFLPITEMLKKGKHMIENPYKENRGLK